MIEMKDFNTPPPIVSIILPVYNAGKYLKECGSHALNAQRTNIQDRITSKYKKHEEIDFYDGLRSLLCDSTGTGSQ